MSEAAGSGGPRAVAPVRTGYVRASLELRPRSDLLGVRWLGRINFADALALQEELVAKKRGDASAPDEILLLEHDPVYTIGRTPDQSSLRGAAHLPFETRRYRTPMRRSEAGA